MGTCSSGPQAQEKDEKTRLSVIKRYVPLKVCQEEFNYSASALVSGTFDWISQVSDSNMGLALTTELSRVTQTLARAMSNSMGGI